MAASYSYTRSGILDGLEAQRHAAAYAARPQVTPEAQAQDIAHRMLSAIEAGDLVTARALALSLRPLLGFMKDEVA